MKRVLLFSIFIIGIILLVACSDSTTGEENSTGSAEQGTELSESITIATPIGIDFMNPYAHSATPAYGMWGYVLEPLVMYNFDTLEYQGILAEDWSVENETDWIFNLREGVTFHDGSEFTSEDVVHSFTRSLEDPDSRQGSFLSMVSTIEAVDENTVKVVTKEPSASFLKDLVSLYITSKSYYDELGKEDADNKPIGTGPFAFKDWERSQLFVVDKNDEYWGGEATVDEVIFQTIPEDVARVTALETGEVDIINAPTQDLTRLEENPNIDVHDISGLRMVMFVLNPAIEPLDNVKVRQAINYAIDVESIVENVQEGQVEKLNGPVSDKALGYNPDIEPYTYDPDKALQLLEEAGYPDGFDLTLYTPTDRYMRDVDVTEVAAAQLKEVGINVTVETPEWGIFSSEYSEGKYGMYLIGRGNVFDADIVMRQYFRTGVTNRTFYSNPEFDEKLDAAEMTFDVEERNELLQEAGMFLYEDAPAVFLYTQIDNYAVSKGIDFTPRPDEYIRVGFPENYN